MNDRPSPVDVADAIRRLLSRAHPVSKERVELGRSAGRVLAEPIAIDRDSPPLDVSAMDGFAVRAADIAAGPVVVRGECRIGAPPETLSAGLASRIYTGVPIPHGADCVVRLEDAECDGAEGCESLSLAPGAAVAVGDHIRLRGENGAAGDVALAAGTRLTAAAVTTAASVGSGAVVVHRRVRVATLVTGDEIVAAGEVADPWRVRDSNGPALAALLAGAPWIEAVPPRPVLDRRAEVERALAAALDEADMVVLTGGVSKGNYDFVPGVVRDAGGDVLFHGLRMRPGQPALAAAARDRIVLGLPGNPLSVLVTACTLLAPAARALAGFGDPHTHGALVEVTPAEGRSIGIEWRRPARIVGDGIARLCAVRGSGDVLGVGPSDGFVVVPAGGAARGPLVYHPWGL